jgi:hypothetical protein
MFKNATTPKPAPIAGQSATHLCGYRPPELASNVQKRHRPQADSHRPRRHHPPLRGSTPPRNWLRMFKNATAPARLPSPPTPAELAPPRIGFESKFHHPQAGSHRPSERHPPLRVAAPPRIGFECSKTPPPQPGSHRPATPAGTGPPRIGFECSKHRTAQADSRPPKCRPPAGSGSPKRIASPRA